MVGYWRRHQLLFGTVVEKVLRDANLVSTKAHPNKLTQLAFQPDGSFLASADADGHFLWDPLEQDEVIGGLELSSSVSCLRWCKEGKFVVGQEDGKVATLE